MLREGDLIFALPSKGQLGDRSQEFLKSCGFAVIREENARAYTATLSGIEGVSIVFFRPDEIPARIEAGAAQVGITGEDLYREYGEGPPASHLLIRDLGYGNARLVLAVPRTWLDVSSLEDLDEVTVQFRRKHGHSLRVATKFAKLTRAFFSANGIADYTIVNSSGATEGAPASGMAELIVDLTSTGSTLRQNHLKEIEGGAVLKTQAGLIVSTRASAWSDSRVLALAQVVETIEARLRAGRNVMLRFNVPSETVEHACAALVATVQCTMASRPGDLPERAPSRSRVVERIAICPTAKLYAATALLKTFGCVQTMVQRSEFIFSERSDYMDQFQRLLKRLDATRSPLNEPAGAQSR